MKILYIVQHFTGPSGSSSSRPYENARKLVGMGHEVTLVCGTSKMNTPQDEEDARLVGIDFVRAPILYDQNFSYLKRLLVFRSYMKWAIRKCKELPKPDLVFASSTPLSVGEIGLQAAKHHGVPFVFEVRDMWPEVAVALGALKNPVLRMMAYRLARKIYSNADHVVALSENMKKGVAAWGFPEEHITVIPNCSDTDLFGSKAQRDSMRQAMGWENKFVCIHPGAMGLVNNLDYLLDTAKELERRGADDIHIALVGNGKQKAHLKQRIEDENIRLAALYDPVPKRDMPKLLAASDVGAVTVLPMDCLAADSANKLFDFLATGLPVVLNYNGWSADMLKESGAGTNSDPKDPSTMADLLISLHDDPQRLRDMGAAARSLAETRFNREVLVAKLEKVLVDVVQGKRAHS